MSTLSGVEGPGIGRDGAVGRVRCDGTPSAPCPGPRVHDGTPLSLTLPGWVSDR